MPNEELQQAIAWFENRLSAAVMPGAREVFGIAVCALREKQERDNEHIGETTEMIPNPVAPIVHGEWVLVGTNEHDYETSVEEKCSLCGRYVYRYDTQPQDNYCPNCGAKMDAKSEVEK